MSSPLRGNGGTVDLTLWAPRLVGVGKGPDREGGCGGKGGQRKDPRAEAEGSCLALSWGALAVVGW